MTKQLFIYGTVKKIKVKSIMFRAALVGCSSPFFMPRPPFSVAHGLQSTRSTVTFSVLDRHKTADVLTSAPEFFVSQSLSDVLY